MKHALRCRCGTVQGEVEADRSAGRARCYCRDCQAFARFLGRDGEILDTHGGTQIVACLPAKLRFTAGVDRIACMSLSSKGLLRWYADCCRTPIGNTPRDPKMPYVGLVRQCLPGDDAAIEASFGRSSIALNTRSSRGRVASTPVATVLGVVKIMRNVIGARLSGAYRRNPFFDAAPGRPLKAPRVLSLAEREALRSGV